MYVCTCAQSHLTLCNPMQCSPPGSSVHGIFRARILEWPMKGYSNLLFDHWSLFLWKKRLRKKKKKGQRFCYSMGFPGGSEVKVSASNAGDLGSIPRLGRSPGEGNGNPLQYSCLENPMDGGAWWATVHGVAKSQTRLSDLTFTF